MIVDPTTDQACLGQLTKMARELAPTTLLTTVARRLGSPTNVAMWLRSLPQTDDDGHELFRYVSCDVAQRVRLLPDDPNCFERAFAALALLEVLDPFTQRMLVTIDHPVRHTGVVELRNRQWRAIDLFPRRNFDWGEFGKDVLQGVHKYVGKPLLGAYGAGAAADWLEGQENSWIGRDKKNEKKQQPPSKQEQPAAKQPATQQSGVGQVAAVVSKLGATGAKNKDTTSPKGGNNEKGKEPHSGSAAGPGTGRADGDGRASLVGAASQAKRWGGWG